MRRRHYILWIRPELLQANGNLVIICVWGFFQIVFVVF
jgi:hypothetical protein